MGTPETDAIARPYHPEDKMLKKAKDLERRLTIARDTLTKILNSDMDPRRVEPLIEETLKATAP